MQPKVLSDPGRSVNLESFAVGSEGFDLSGQVEVSGMVLDLEAEVVSGKPQFF